ncbi:sugar isomerase [Kitasatospora sp. NBC_01250]|uniref:SIS domain-containing protein n=1 Tax=Kitasatospora sp. NBC_01250 TaxID=2903571 RepID=UPI002E3216E4|nr:sugar isomerase [Kitasatospora sp. NBC_01250]
MTAIDSSLTAEELATQPDCWRRAATLAGTSAAALPRRGERIAAVGCGTSWFMAQSYAALREAAGQGETDAFAASEFPGARDYDRVVAITRSGTTTEVLTLLGALRGRTATTALTADPHTPVMTAADQVVVLDFADERSVVQTRFATSALALLRAHLAGDGAGGEGPGSVAKAAADAERALEEPLPEGLLTVDQVTFLGGGWTNGLALEAGLKMREAACFWTEAYPAMEYRHGPIAITGPGRAAWMFGELPEGLAGDIAATGGLLVAGSGAGGLDPMADLVRAQRLAVALATARGLDPDNPRALTRSVQL